MEPSRGAREPAPDAAEARFRTVADTAPGLLWTAGADERSDFLKQSWLAFTGRALGVFSRDPVRRFGPADVESLKLLGAMAAATLVGVERARVEGALLGAYTAQHEVHNRLALTVGYVELISMSGKRPHELREAAGEAVSGVAGDMEELNKLGQLRQLAERDWGPNARRPSNLKDSLG